MRERLVVSVFLAILVHFILLLVLQLALKIERTRIPEYTGPLYVTLGETPEVAPVIEKAEEPRQLPRMEREQPRVEQSSTEQARGSAASSLPLLRPVPTPETQPAARSHSPLTFLGEAQKPSGDKHLLPPDSTGDENPPAQTRNQQPTVAAQQAPVTQENVVKPMDEPDQPLILGDEIQNLEKIIGQPGQPDAPNGTREAEPVTLPSTETQSASAQKGRDYDIQWEDSSPGRDPTQKPKPRIPDSAKREGRDLQVVVSFELTAQGVLRDIRVVKGSGNTEMDTAVQDALRLWKFPPIAPTTRTVKGRITYWIIPR